MGVDVKARARELECVSFVMSDKRGREFLWRLMGICGLKRSVALTHPKGILPEERMSYNGAQQDIAQGIENEIYEADPSGQQHAIMVSEARVRKVLADQEAKKKQKKETDDDGSRDDGTSDDGTESNPT